MTDYIKMRPSTSNLINLELESFIPTSLPNVLNLIAICCPRMKKFELSSTCLDIQKSDLQNLSDICKTRLNKITVRNFSDLSLANLFQIIGRHCPCLRECIVDSRSLDVQYDSEFGTVFGNQGITLLTEIVIRCKNVINLENLFYLMGICFPNINECRVTCDRITLPNHRPSTDMKKLVLVALILEVNGSILFSKLLKLILSLCPKLNKCDIKGTIVEDIHPLDNTCLHTSFKRLHIMCNNPIHWESLFVFVNKCAPHIKQVEIGLRNLSSYIMPIDHANLSISTLDAGYLMIHCNDDIHVPHLIHLVVSL